MLETVVRRIVAPPTVNAGVSASATSPTSLASQVLASSGIRGATVTPTRQRCVTCHPSLPLICYTLDVVNAPLSMHRQLVVQDSKTRQVVWQWSLRELASELFGLNSDKVFNFTNSKLQVALKALGRVQRVSFLDPSTAILQDAEESSWFQHVAIHLHQRVVVWDIRTNRLVRQFTQANLSSAHPTTSALALTTKLMAIGCADGSFRVYDTASDKVLKSARAGASKIDALWDIVNVTTFDEQHGTASVRTARIAVLNKKGTAIVWELVVDVREHSLVEIRPPLARLEGQFTSTQLSLGGDARTEATSTNSATSGSKADGTADASTPSMEHVLVDYDGHRDYIFWFVPLGYKGSNKPHVLVWDLNIVSAEAIGRSKTPKPEPFVMSITSVDIDPMTLVAGWVHPSYSSTDILCAVVTQSGKLHVVGMPRSEASAGRATETIPVFSLHVSLILQSDSALPPPRLHVQSLATLRRLDPSTLMVGTDLGVLVVRVQETTITGAARHVHFGNSMGEWSRSVLMVHGDSSIAWGQLQVPHRNPQGAIHVKNPKTVHGAIRSGLLSLSPEAQRQSPVVGPAPVLLPSPSGRFLCILWQDEERYEIVHMASLLRRNDDGSRYSASVSSGIDVVSFAWVGDDDVFAVLHPPAEQKEGQTHSFRTNTTLSSKESSVMLGAGGGSKKKALRKSFDFVKKGKSMTSPLTSEKSVTPTSATNTAQKEGDYTNDGSRFLPRVELRTLIRVTANAAEIGGSISAATETSFGEITLRGGNRSPASALFGGPVLCVASDGDTNSTKDRGVAYFYTRKTDTDGRASSYVSSGPAIPSPDLVEWDEDGRICAVIVESRISVFLSHPPQLSLLGNVQLGSPTDPDVTVTGAKFIHGVLYCTTETSVQCIFLGNLESGICHMDSFMLASVGHPSLRSLSATLAPPSLSMALNHPLVLGYQSGSLLLSTSTGLHAVSLSHPLLRIGSLLAAELSDQAKPWLDLIEEYDHEALSAFLERRGEPVLAAELPGLSVETTIDFCLRYDLTERLEALIEDHGLQSIRNVDEGRPTIYEVGYSLVVSVGAYLLSKGKFEIVRRLATECLQCGRDGKNDAFVLAGLLSAVDPSDARRLIVRAVGANSDDHKFSDDGRIATKPVLALVRDHIIH